MQRALLLHRWVLGVSDFVTGRTTVREDPVSVGGLGDVPTWSASGAVTIRLRILSDRLVEQGVPPKPVQSD